MAPYKYEPQTGLGLTKRAIRSATGSCAPFDNTFCATPASHRNPKSDAAAEVGSTPARFAMPRLGQELAADAQCSGAEIHRAIADKIRNLHLAPMTPDQNTMNLILPPPRGSTISIQRTSSLARALLAAAKTSQHHARFFRFFCFAHNRFGHFARQSRSILNRNASSRRRQLQGDDANSDIALQR